MDAYIPWRIEKLDFLRFEIYYWSVTKNYKKENYELIDELFY